MCYGRVGRMSAEEPQSNSTVARQSDLKHKQSRSISKTAAATYVALLHFLQRTR
jgi:hypothetical protein